VEAILSRKQVLAEVENLINAYCSGCFLKQQFKKDYGKRYAHQFCIKNCTVGEKIRGCGEKLLDESNITR
jgi:Zinc-finger